MLPFSKEDFEHYVSENVGRKITFTKINYCEADGQIHAYLYDYLDGGHLSFLLNKYNNMYYMDKRIRWCLEDSKSKTEVEGYHKTKIQKGVIGEASKIFEEVEEFKDAIEQKCKLMALIELSDLYGAMELYLKKHHSNLTMKDLEDMSKITQRVFENGFRL